MKHFVGELEGMRTRRSWLTTVASLGMILAVLPAISCKTAASGVHPATAVVAPEFESLNIQTVSLVTVGSSVGEELARQVAEFVAEEQLTSNQDRFVVLGVQTSRDRAGASGVGEDFERLAKAWRDHRLADKFLVQTVCGKLGVDALMFGDLLDWKKEKIDFTQEGTSYTQISLRLVIVSGKTGMPVWEAQKMVRRDSLAFEPGGAASGVSTDGSGVARAQRIGGQSPDPPRPEDVLVDVMASLMAAFPARAAK